MKKIVLICSALIILSFAVIGCSRSDVQNKSGNAEGEIVATQEAKIKNNDAISYISNSYTKQELGLDAVKEDYSFMVSSNGVTIDGESYIKVVANVVAENKEVTAKDGNSTFTMKTVGEYCISFDGQKVLKKNMNTGEYTQLEVKKADYSSKGDTTSKAK